VITVTRLNGQPFVLNAELIRTIESNPDTVVTLIGGDKLIVKEPMPEIVRRVIDYRVHLRTMVPPA